MSSIQASPWREPVRALALQRAEVEARQAWRVDEDAPIPFNYRWEHVQAVVGLALWLAEEMDADPEAVEAAAWLHDIRKGEPEHGQRAAEEAEAFLPKVGFPPAKVEAVVQALVQHEGLTRPPAAPPLRPLEAAILWDADKLSKLGVQAMAHGLRSPGAWGASLAEVRIGLADFVAQTAPRTVASMNTPPARALAETRYRNMVDALARWSEEETECIQYRLNIPGMGCI